MFSFCSRKFLHIKWSGNASTRLFPILKSSLRFTSNATEQELLTVDYLINRCGLTQESAFKASRRINNKSTTKADSVLALLNSYGLPKSCISKIISTYPTLLSADPKKTLEPKFEFLSSMGISGPDLARVLNRCPSIIAGASLRNKIIPLMKFLKSLLHNDKNVAAALSRLRWTASFLRFMQPNIEILRNHKVPDSGISKLILLCPQFISLKHTRVNEVVLQAKEMGCDPLSLMFPHALRALCQTNKTTLEAKMEVFRSFGWSEDAILCVFRKQPTCFCRLEEILRVRLDFFMNKLSMTVAEIVKNPVILLLSMEKRIVPRYSVIQVLLSQDLMKKQSISNALFYKEDKFLEKYVKKYHQELPQLLKVYKHSMK